jgi:dipeptidyl aminopeptidase/acylaminoacyl peptidase
MKRILVITSVIIASIYLGICYYFSSRIIIPGRAEVPELFKMSEPYAKAKEVTFRTRDYLTLSGWYLENPKDGDCGIILLHGRNSSRYGMRHWMPYFWAKGCDLLAYDHRAHGESEGDYGTFGIYESYDLLEAHDWLKDKADLSDDQIGWVGASWGAATALQTEMTETQPMFILADSPYKDLDAAVMERAIRDYGDWVKALVPTIYWMVQSRAEFNPYITSTEEKAKNVNVPTLLIHSQTDQATSSDQSVAIADVMDQDILTFHHTDWGSLHCKDVQDEPEKYGQLIDDFLAANDLLQPIPEDTLIEKRRLKDRSLISSEIR